MKKEVVIIPRISVNSSNVAEIGYSNEKQILSIKMLNERIYYYLDVPKKHFIELTNPLGDGVCHPAIGSYMHRNIKEYYRFIEVSEFVS